MDLDLRSRASRWFQNKLGTKGTFRLFVSSAQVDRGEDRPARFIIIAPDDFSAYSGNVP